MCLAGSSPRFRLDRLSCLHQDGAECPRASPLFLPIVSIFARGAPAHFAIVLAIHSAAASHSLKRHPLLGAFAPLEEPSTASLAEMGETFGSIDRPVGLIANSGASGTRRAAHGPPLLAT